MYVAHVNGWYPVIYMSYMSGHFRLIRLPIEYIRSKHSFLFAHLNSVRLSH